MLQEDLRWQQEPEISGGRLVVDWGNSCKASPSTGDGSGGGPSDAQVSNRILDYESSSEE